MRVDVPLAAAFNAPRHVARLAMCVARYWARHVGSTRSLGDATARGRRRPTRLQAWHLQRSETTRAPNCRRAVRGAVRGVLHGSLRRLRHLGFVRLTVERERLVRAQQVMAFQLGRFDEVEPVLALLAWRPGAQLTKTDGSAPGTLSTQRRPRPPTQAEVEAARAAIGRDRRDTCLCPRAPPRTSPMPRDRPRWPPPMRPSRTLAPHACP